MARTKRVSENMGDLIEALAEFRLNEATIRAEYARKAEQKIAESRDNVLDLMFIKHAGSGPSEIANTTGLSRSTVIRWRSEWQERQSALPADLLFNGLSKKEEGAGVEAAVDTSPASNLEGLEATVEFSLEHSEESNENVHVIVNNDADQKEKVYVIWGDTFATGEDPDNAELIDRPDWLTDAILLDAESATGLEIPGAVHR